MIADAHTIETFNTLHEQLMKAGGIINFAEQLGGCVVASLAAEQTPPSIVSTYTKELNDSTGNHRTDIVRLILQDRELTGLSQRLVGKRGEQKVTDEQKIDESPAAFLNLYVREFKQFGPTTS